MKLKNMVKDNFNLINQKNFQPRGHNYNRRNFKKNQISLSFQSKKETF